MRAALAAACLCAALALLCAPAPVAASRPRRALLAPAPGALGQSGPRPSGTRLARTCACVDSGINSRPCFEAVTAYCSDAAGRPDARVCAAMSGFINQQDFPSGKVVAKFLIDTCRVKLPDGPSACPCLDGFDTPGCRAAALNACLLGNTLCPATVFGPEALPASQESFALYVSRQCDPGSKVTTRLDLNFTGIGKDDFQLRYAKGAAAAVASLAQVPVPAVTASRIREVHFPKQGGGGGYDKVLLTTYLIRSDPRDAPKIVQRLQAAGPAGADAALASNGVPLAPSFRVGGDKAGAAGGRGGGGGGLGPGAIAGIAIGATAGGLLLLAGVTYLILRARKSKPTESHQANSGKQAAAVAPAGAGSEGRAGKGAAAAAAAGAASAAAGAAEDTDGRDRA